jgi:hypothetical protein
VQCAYIPSCCFHLINLFPLHWSIPFDPIIPRPHVWIPNIVSFTGEVFSFKPSPQPGGPGLHIYKPRRQGGPVIPPGTGSPFWLPFMTCMSYGGAILIPWLPHRGFIISYRFIFITWMWLFKYILWLDNTLPSPTSIVSCWHIIVFTKWNFSISSDVFERSHSGFILYNFFRHPDSCCQNWFLEKFFLICFWLRS